ncbi:MAG TPA: wax ester/triacylglycerol synthase family O-acyltransferase [Solirubrobacteraceae bacterium]|nr:wax ester/triacylglycerol synthase family O-acyltransferase [Solirubrobacteraceae bacterium]
MGHRLTALDATFLELEEADESAHMHIGAIMVFDASEHGHVPSRAELCAHLGRRLGRLPRYSERLSRPHTGGLTWPEWQPDPCFALSEHVRRAALPAPGGHEELAEWASGFFSQRLDRHRALWDMAIVEGLSDGRWALATKTHHCMVDGVGSVDVGHLILDTEPDASALRGPPRRTRRRAAKPAVEPADSDGALGGEEPGALGRLAHAWGGLLPVDAVAHAAQMGAHGALHPREALFNARAAVAMILTEELKAAPHTSLNRPIGTERRFDVVQIPLDDLRAIRGALGGTINDVILAVVAGAVRELLVSRGELPPEQGLRAMVPMNVRAASEHLALGNRVSSLFIELPVSEPDAERRYRETSARSLALKAGGQQAAGTTAVIEFAALAPPILHSTIAQALYANRLFNITITNVPGPQQTLYAFGSPLREIHPLVPLAAEHALGVAIVSYDGDAFVGVVADRDTVPDMPVMLGAVRRSVEELLAAALSPAVPSGHR